MQTIPCTISADRKGFSIKVLGVSRYYSYDSLSGIECEIARNRIGKTAIILVITEESGKVTKYCEKLGIVPEDADMKSISRLIKFCRYAEKKIGYQEMRS